MIEEHARRLPIDIHGGGIDLVFPHHENEIAQGDVRPPRRRRSPSYWLHNGFLNIERREDVEVPRQLLHRPRPARPGCPGEAIRLALLSTHYRQPLDWTERKA